MSKNVPKKIFPDTPSTTVNSVDDKKQTPSSTTTMVQKAVLEFRNQLKLQTDDFLLTKNSMFGTVLERIKDQWWELFKKETQSALISTQEFKDHPNSRGVQIPPKTLRLIFPRIDLMDFNECKKEDWGVMYQDLWSPLMGYENRIKLPTNSKSWNQELLDTFEKYLVDSGFKMTPIAGALTHGPQKWVEWNL